MNKKNLQQKDQLNYYNLGSADYEKKRILLTRKLDRASRRKAQIIEKKLNAPLNRILEIGAGSGLISYSLTKKLNYKEYIVTDLSRKMLEDAKRRLSSPPPLHKRVIFEVDDAHASKFKNNKFNAVIGIDIIHHLADPELAMQELLRISKPKAKLVFLETNAYNPLIMLNIGLEHEVRCFLNTDTNLKKWLSNAGWTNIKVVPAPSFTPSCPKWLSPFFDLLDRIFVRIPKLNKFSALWLITAEKK
jgi:ubiquinone/menaquinone biosynthesis C-methylase UbiE